MLTLKPGALVSLGLGLIAAVLLAALSSCTGGMSFSQLAQDSSNSGALPPSGNDSNVRYFDTNGQTSSFGIPGGVRGSISAGEHVYKSVCVACHITALPVMDFSQVKARMRQQPMSKLGLNDQQLADLTAWLNRDSIPPPGTK